MDTRRRLDVVMVFECRRISYGGLGWDGNLLQAGSALRRRRRREEKER
jgi:hypothetical protein